MKLDLKALNVLSVEDNSSVETPEMFFGEASPREFFYTSNCDASEREVEISSTFVLSQRRLKSLCASGSAAHRLLNTKTFLDVTRTSGVCRLFFDVNVMHRRIICLLRRQGISLRILICEEFALMSI
jgi:hypothetical protein